MALIKYTEDHEYIIVDGDIGTVGVTNYAQEKLGDVTFVELPASGEKVKQGGPIAVVEAVKAASDIYAPMAGKVTEVNRKLEDTPALINKDCYGKGWIAKIEVRDMDESTNLMSAEEYRNYLESLH